MTKYDDTSTDRGAGDESAAVTGVLAAIEALHDRPVDEHVAVYEHAHEQLRRALEPRHG